MAYKLQQITWSDHCSGHGWKTQEEVAIWAVSMTKVMQKTFGYVTFENEDVVILSMSVADDGQAFGHMLIMKPSIVKRKTIKIA